MANLLDIAIPAATAILGAGGGTTIALALIKRSEGRDRDVAKVTAVGAREDTARLRIADGAAAREGTVLERLHDDCRKEVADLREEVHVERDARLKLTEDVARCEERHRASEHRESDYVARIERLERRSNPPAMEPAE